MVQLDEIRFCVHTVDTYSLVAFIHATLQQEMREGGGAFDATLQQEGGGLLTNAPPLQKLQAVQVSEKLTYHANTSRGTSLTCHVIEPPGHHRSIWHRGI